MRTWRSSPDPATVVSQLSAVLDAAWRRTAAGYAANPGLRVEHRRGRDEIVLTPLDADPEPASLVTLRARVEALLPEVEIADGMRFVIPVSTIYSAYNPRYFGRRRGSTLYSWMADTHTVFAQRLIPAPSATACMSSTGSSRTRPASSPRWSPPTPLAPPIVFALAWALGYRWAPRLADLPDQRLWRIDGHAHYDALNGLARTIYTQAVLDHLAANGYPLYPADIARLSPLGHPTINLDGRYRTTSHPPDSGLRPLRAD